MITPAFGLTATERVLPKLALDFTTAVLDARVTVTRTTNATNPATYIDSSGVITAATNNQPRFDYDPVTLLCRGLLIEESRANSLLNTDLLATQIVTVTAAVRTLSFYGTGSVTLSGAHVAVVSGTGAYPTRITYSFTPSAGVLTLTVAGTVQFAQLEAGAFATSYIPTTTTSLTRNGDVASMTGTNFSSWYNQSEGAIVCSVSGGKNSVWAVSYDMGTSGNLAYVRQTSPTAVSSVINGSGSAGTSITADTAYTTVLAYKINDCAFAINGGQLSTFAGTPGTATDLIIGSLNGSFVLNGHVKKLMFYPQRLTNAECVAFSK